MVYSSLGSTVGHQFVHKFEDVRIFLVMKPSVTGARGILWRNASFTGCSSCVEMAGILLAKDPLSTI